MRDVDLYRHLLGLETPWTVAKVDLDVKAGRVDVWAEHRKAATWACPECGTACGLYDHAEERVWRHLDSCQFLTYLHARVPRVKCPTHGVKQVTVAWAEPRSRFTALFERLAIDVLREADIAGAATILRLSWDEAFHLMERAVARGQARKPRALPARLGVDEKAAGKGQDYVTIVTDLEAATVEYVGDGRTTASLEGYLFRFSLAELATVQAVATDMWQPYVTTVMTYIEGADGKLVFDRFHIAKHMGEAVDQVRRGEHRALHAAGDDRLKGSRYFWLYRPENVPAALHTTFEALRGSDLRTARAWSLKETLRNIWDCGDVATAATLFKRWYFVATHSQLAPVIRVAKMIKTRLTNVLTYFAHGITSATCEGVNNAIATLVKRAYGYRNRAHFKTAIYFHCGGLDLYPATHAIAG